MIKEHNESAGEDDNCETHNGRPSSLPCGIHRRNELGLCRRELAEPEERDRQASFNRSPSDRAVGWDRLPYLGLTGHTPLTGQQARESP